ncbi:G-protein coupled receptor family C group 6 member A-like [Alosa sapidissima]|uniref:G-protein coupled receptor family C group 6 member A-like n=1 Tax=Alosa sapidissima TaxID=34773 RepID=UPI001C09ADF2|nr:G-protein coupled receptor family C group 6 member A-like [Alosa sapidissima]
MATHTGLCYLCLVVVASWGSLHCSSYPRPLKATKDGDIIIGGIFPVHESVNFQDDYDGRPSGRNCTRYSVARLLQVLMLVEAVEAVNHSPLLGNLTLGYHIVDSCSDVSTAVVVMQRLLDVCPWVSWSRPGRNNSRPVRPARSVSVVVGGYHSEISIAVARQLSINQIPQISYGSTTGILSDKSRFPAFMRTVPEDNYQAQAIVDILVAWNWTWVGVVTTDGDYGRYAAQRFQEHAKEKGICVAFYEVLSDILDDTSRERVINRTVQNIERDPNIGVIVSFAKPDHMKYLMSMLSLNATGRIWVASDNWATSSRVVENRTLSEIGTVIGVTLKTANMSHFQRYVDGLDPDPAAHQNNTILQQYLWSEGKDMTQPELGAALKKKIYPYAVFSVGLAVRAIARAVANLCANRDCRGGNNFKPWELKNALRNSNFTLGPDDPYLYKFDQHGDLNTGYDVILWKQNGENIDMTEVVAKYNISPRGLSFVNEAKISNLVGNVTSRCSPSCGPGKRKVTDHKPVCCFVCEACSNNTFNNATDSKDCMTCEAHQWSEEGSSRCLDKKIVFFGWKDNFAIVLLSFAALGVLLTLVVLVLFLAQWSTPVVRASVGPISLLLLISLLGTFVSAVLFVGRPNNPQCQARQVLFGLSFTLCVSCILVKSLNILLAFQIDLSKRFILDKLFQPYLIIAACVAIQVGICTAWLVTEAPCAEQKDLGRNQIILQCNEGNMLFFGLMLGYIGLLSLIGFVIAFMGRGLPDGYNEAKFITFSMVIYLICWVVFGPVYAHSHADLYLPAVEMIVILFTAYGILCTLFLPKCYIILFRKERNTKEAFRQNVRDYTQRPSLEPPSISLTDDPSSNGQSYRPLQGSSSQASLVPREEVPDGRVSPLSAVSSAHLTPKSPPAAPGAQHTFLTGDRTTPVNQRKKSLVRCATVH